MRGTLRTWRRLLSGPGHLQSARCGFAFVNFLTAVRGVYFCTRSLQYARRACQDANVVIFDSASLSERAVAFLAVSSAIKVVSMSKWRLSRELAV